MACDGIEAVGVDPDTGSVIVDHSGEFSWSSIGPAALRLDEGGCIDPARRPLPGRAPDPASAPPPVGPLTELAVALALELAVTRRAPAEIVRDIALSFLRAALRETRRA